MSTQTKDNVTAFSTRPKGARVARKIDREAFGFAYSLQTPVWVYDIDGRCILFANASACRLWQASTEAELCSRDLGKDMSTSVAERLKQYQNDFIASDATFNEMWTLYPDNVPTSVMVNYSGYPLQNGQMAMLCEATGYADDQPENLRSAEALLHTDVMITLFNLDGKPLYMNPAARKAAPAGVTLGSMFADPTDHELLLYELQKNGVHRMITRVSTPAGLCWYDVSAKHCLDAATGKTALLTTYIDVSELKDARDRARYLASRDQLTGCYNRSFLQQRMSELTLMSGQCALLYFDVDRFKQINDRFGHEMGDLVLKMLVERARGAIRKKDLIARLGGDEFVILFEDTPSAEEFSTQISRLFNQLTQPFETAAAKLNVTVSMGMSFFHPGGNAFDDILREADIALYASKQAGRNRLTYFCEELGNAAKARDQLEIELKRAVEQQQFTLHYQPRVDLKSGKVVAAEALVRWNHPDRGLVMPNEFIPSCEESGLIEQVGQQVLTMGCETAFDWASQGLGLQLSINISPRQFNDAKLMETLAAYASAPDFPKGQIELEITENVLIGDLEAIAIKLEAITKMGYQIAIDDFGMGYSNLSYISRFPLNCIKIDRSFVQQLPKSGPIVRLILTMARQIGASTVAEGVETKEQLDWFVGQDCTQVQGYFFSKPKPHDAFLSVARQINSETQPG
ncbi:MAG: EAL domain-containing protein [Pseudomonadota bacterium]